MGSFPHCYLLYHIPLVTVVPRCDFYAVECQNTVSYLCGGKKGFSLRPQILTCCDCFAGDLLPKVSFIFGVSHRKMRFTSTWCWTLSLRPSTGLLDISTKPRVSFPSYMSRYISKFHCKENLF